MSVEFITDPAPQGGGETRTQQRQMDCGYIYRDIFCHKLSDSDQNYGYFQDQYLGTEGVWT